MSYSTSNNDSIQNNIINSQVRDTLISTGPVSPRGLEGEAEVFKMCLHELEMEISSLQGEYFNKSSVQPETIKSISVELKVCF